MSRRAGLIAGLALLLGSSATLAAGAAYKWTDAQGQVHYDDQNAASGERLTRETMNKRQVKPVDDASTRLPQAVIDATAQRCGLAREREASFSGAGRLYVRDRSGASRALSNAQMASIRGDIRQQVQQACADGAVEPFRHPRREPAPSVTPDLQRR